MLKYIWHFAHLALSLPRGCGTSVVPFPRHRGLKISVGYYSNVQKLAGRRTKKENNGDAHLVWAFS